MTEFNNRYLSDIKEGEEVVVLKIKGYGAFRKRITEMGFNRGTTVKVIKRSPLKDPIEYELMGYRVSLRNSEAMLIKVISLKDAKKLTNNEYNGVTTIEDVKQIIEQKEKKINIALVGNPNCGKTTLFNLATHRHEKVGNYGGVTVDLKTALIKEGEYEIDITDLPGTYSMSEFSPEELYVREHIANAMPDVVVNVIDASNLERNLFLTTQLIDMNIRVIIVLNMYDEMEDQGNRLDHNKLSALLGCPVIPTVATKGRGLKELIAKVIDVYTDKDKASRHIHINYGSHISGAIDTIDKSLKQIPPIYDRYHTRYIAIKLLEGDSHFRKLPGVIDNDILLKQIEDEQYKLEDEFKDDTQTLISDAKYNFVRGALKETFTPSKEDLKKASYGADILLTSRWFGIPIFIFAMWAMFQLTFSLGSTPMSWIETGIGMLSELAQNYLEEGMLKDLLIDGIIGGVGGVAIFLPNILILFFCISLMEDTGYMARTAFIMDRAMHKIGLHGKSFIPMLMGFGCNVPAIMATRTLENRKDRIITMLIIPFMSCSARLPVYMLFTSAFFFRNQGLILLSIYVIGVVVAALVSLVMSKIVFKNQDVPFVMELPPYRSPTLKNTLIHMWEKSIQYISKMGGLILVASILIWALGYFPQQTDYTVDYDSSIEQVKLDKSITVAEQDSVINSLEILKESERMERSYIGRLGHTIEPVIRPLGFDWKLGVSIVTGIAAKEIVVSSMSVLYQSTDKNVDITDHLQSQLQSQTYLSGDRAGEKVFSPLIAYVFMLFILIYFPCIAVVAAIKRELGLSWALFSVGYTTGLAWIICFIVYQIGKLFIG